MSIETTSIILSVISLSGTLIATGVGAYMTIYSDERKAKREVDKILLKYRDPLLLSVQDLQARFYGLADRDILEFKTRDAAGEDMYRDNFYIYTAYVVGQYLSWAWILRRQAQFMALMSNNPRKINPFQWTQKHDSATALMRRVDLVKTVFAEDKHGSIEKPFMLFKADQSGIGEIMSCQDTSSREYYCMGYATFAQRWKNGDPKLDSNSTTTDHSHEKMGDYMAGVSKISDKEFRHAFKSIEDGLENMYRHRMESREIDPKNVHNKGSDGRLRRLQHLLLDLAHELDPKGLLHNKDESRHTVGLPECRCSRAPCHVVEPPTKPRSLHRMAEPAEPPKNNRVPSISHGEKEQNGGAERT